MKGQHSKKRQLPFPYSGEDLCQYGCGQTSLWKYRSGKLCCSVSFNSCPEKRRKFSENIDHKTYSAKSLETRIRLGITKSSQIKASVTRKALGTYIRTAAGIRKRHEERPYTNNPRCPILNYKNTSVPYQGSYERIFLEGLEEKNGIDWIELNVSRGPGIWYLYDNRQAMYLPDFLIGNTVYEIKSGYTWNKHGKDLDLERQNIAKLQATVAKGFKVILVKDHTEEEFNG